jgi:hypothetical protein
MVLIEIEIRGWKWGAGTLINFVMWLRTYSKLSQHFCSRQ